MFLQQSRLARIQRVGTVRGTHDVGSLDILRGSLRVVLEREGGKYFHTETLSWLPLVVWLRVTSCRAYGCCESVLFSACNECSA